MNLRNNQHGTSILEMLMFTPIALLFIFVGTDSALRFVEQASVVDAIRSSLKAEATRLDELPLFDFSINGEATINESSLQVAAQGVFQNIKEQIEIAKSGLPSGSEQASQASPHRREQQIEVIPFIVPVDSISGRLDTSGITYYPSSEQNTSQYGNVDPSDITKLLDSSQQDSDVASNYAIILGQNHQASTSTLRYFDKALFLYIRVKGQTNGITPGSNDSSLSLSSLFEIEERHLVPLRTIAK